MYAGTPMAFLRTVGCSVGKGVCTHCDTEFDAMDPQFGGGAYEPAEIASWAWPYKHACLTGGEPLDRDLRPVISALAREGVLAHIETSGTRRPDWLDMHMQPRRPGAHALRTGQASENGGLGLDSWQWMPLWVTVSPKPGWIPDMVERVADEVKWIIGGLGDGPGWPVLADALRWADAGRVVYAQPRNHRFAVDADAMAEALALVDRHPQLRLSTQLHKFLRTR